MSEVSAGAASATQELNAGPKHWLHRLVLGDAGLLLPAFLCGLLVLFATAGPDIPNGSVSRLLAGSGAASWLPVCGLACWRGVVRRVGTRGALPSRYLAS